MPFCSVIIPTFNRAAFLKEAVVSVLGQTFTDFELLVIDDGSTDATPEIINGFRFDRRLKYIKQKNSGVAAARNSGIKAAGSSWLVFLDSDDTWLPKKLDKQISFLKEKPHLKICQTEERWVRRGVQVNHLKHHQKSGGWIFEKCLPLCLVSPSAVMIHREVFEKVGLFDDNFMVCEDYELWLRVSLVFEIGLYPEALIIKRGGHPDQLSRKFQVVDTFRVRALEKILNHPLSPEQKSEVFKTISEKSRIISRGAFKRVRFLTGIKYGLKYLKYRPAAVLS